MERQLEPGKQYSINIKPHLTIYRLIFSVLVIAIRILLVTLILLVSFRNCSVKDSNYFMSSQQLIIRIQFVGF